MFLRLPEVADKKLVYGVSRSPSEVETQLRKPAGDQPFDARLDRSAPGTGGADDVGQVAIGRFDRRSMAPMLLVGWR